MPLRIRCPECRTELDVPAGVRPVCPRCGFAGRGHAAMEAMRDPSGPTMPAMAMPQMPLASSGRAPARTFTPTMPAAAARAPPQAAPPAADQGWAQPAEPANVEWATAGDVEWQETSAEGAAPNGVSEGAPDEWVEAGQAEWPQQEADTPKRRGLFGRKKSQ